MHSPTHKLLRANLLREYRLMAEPLGTAWGMASIAMHAGGATLAAVVASYLNSPIVSICAILWIGTRMRAFGNIIHECVHQSFVKNAVLNLAIGNVLSVFDLRSFKKYRREHFFHHRYLGDTERDPDFLPTSLRWRRYLKNLLPVIFFEGDSVLLNMSRFGWALSIVVLSLSYNAFALYFLLPYFTSYVACRVLSDVMDHYGLAEHKDEFHRSRNHAFKNKLVNLILLPRNDGYHQSHHVFPRLPVHALPAMTNLIGEHIKPEKNMTEASAHQVTLP